MAYNRDGGIFGGFSPGDLMRGVSYKHSGLKSRSIEWNRLNLLFLNRHATRRWLYKYKYLRLLNNNFSEVMNEKKC